MVSADGASVTGTPVYSGVVTGRACVITDLEEASQLLSEDILITNATDIGWTPYFPMLSGVVTELGGLISHGAVVAREYGLPCIVGATSATNIFKTGRYFFKEDKLNLIYINVLMDCRRYGDSGRQYWYIEISRGAK